MQEQSIITNSPLISSNISDNINSDNTRAWASDRRASALNSPSHAHRARARGTYLDYIHTYETQSNNQEVDGKSYKHRIVISGDVIECYSTNHEKVKVEKDEEQNPNEEMEEKPQKKHDEQLEEMEYHRKLSAVHRTRTNLKRLVNANVGQYEEKDKFITLTFEKYLERDEVIKCFKLFQKRLRRRYKDFDFQYIAIIERGTKGTERLHLHTLFFGLPFIPATEFKEIWRYGNIDLKAIDEYNEIANYVLKYVEKTLTEDNYIEKGKKFYITSRNLKRPETVFLNDEEFNALKLRLQEEGRALVFETEFMNKVNLEMINYQKFRFLKKTDIGFIKPNESWTDEQWEE